MAKIFITSFNVDMKIINDTKFPNFKMHNKQIKLGNQNKFSTIKKLATDVFQKTDIAAAIQIVKQLVVEKFTTAGSFNQQQIDWVLRGINNENFKLAQKLVEQEDFPLDRIGGIVNYTTKDNLYLAEKLCSSDVFPKDQISTILWRTTPENINFAEELCFKEDFPKDKINGIINYTNKDTLSFAQALCNDKEFPIDEISKILCFTDKENIEIAQNLYKDKNFPREEISKILVDTNHENLEYAKELSSKFKTLNLPSDKFRFLIKNFKIISVEQLKKLLEIANVEEINKLNDENLVLACQMSELYGKESIDQLTVKNRKTFLQQILKCSKGEFRISSAFKKLFPLIPASEDEYCEVLTQLNTSNMVKTKQLFQNEIKECFQAVDALSGELLILSDAEFNELEFKQSYSKDDFIKNIMKLTQNLPKDELQNLYNTFGFEIYENPKSLTGYSLLKYPTNILPFENKAKDFETYQNVNREIFKFNEQNKIECNNPEIELFINKIATILPEIRTLIDKKQHGTHAFDIFKHSLKVMQKISQDEDFYNLNSSDKKIMLLASLLHDVTKEECEVDKSHPIDGASDAYLLAKKLKLSDDEEYKLFTLIKYHSWLEQANSAKDEEDLNTKLLSIAYDLRFDNVFEMAKIFTHADLKAIRPDDSFHDLIKRKNYDGTLKSFGESCDFYAEKIENYVQQLQYTQPFFPTTEFPSASRVSKAITEINTDGSTNVKGVYVDKDGLVVIKYNEVEDWEKIGFPNGSISRGIETKGVNQENEEFDINTGNIKFFVHGLEFENQLRKLKALSSIDSEAVLSNTYSERPESKYRFFRPQGAILSYDARNVHAGGKSDSGSGYAKTIANIKREYLFGTKREADRNFSSELIKNVTGMTNENFLRFVKSERNKPFSSIEPQDISLDILKAYAGICSRQRDEAREYNEVCCSNIKRIMAVFAYNINPNEPVGNPIDFLSRDTVSLAEVNYKGIGSKSVYERTYFLRKYAIENDIPFVVFGD